jgi:hypothetical protein
MIRVNSQFPTTNPKTIGSWHKGQIGSWEFEIDLPCHQEERELT